MALSDMNNTQNTNPDYNYCALPLAAYACRPDRTAGRIHTESHSNTRTPFQRDRDRIIHASAFRRLKYKTQVFVYHQGDHYRTRLTHTLEVAQITRSIARALMVNEDLAEGIALAHDLGHTPFAHIGEVFLNQCMTPFGGFDHNDQSLRILTTLERKYPKWDGLNLTWESLEGVVKHNGPVTGDLHIAARELQTLTDLRLNTYASLEAQVAALSDDIAYNNHDVEDGLRAGLFTLDDLRALPLLARAFDVVRDEHGDDLERRYVITELISTMIGMMVSDVLKQTRKNLETINPQSPDDVRNAGMQIVAFSDSMRRDVDGLRKFLFARMYDHFTINRIKIKVEKIVCDLFGTFMKHPNVLPNNWQATITAHGGDTDDHIRARVVADYIAGMTDRFAIREHEKLFDVYWDLR